EGFTNYSETIYTEWLFGKAAGNEYNYGIRSRIQNKTTITGAYNVNNEGSGDMYYKAGNMLHLIRHSINDDEKFREILRGLNANFYHQTVTSKQVETYISKQSKINFSKVFDQYLRTTQIPVLEYYYSADSSRLYFRWNNCVKGFNLRVAMESNKEKLIIYPSQKWKSMKLVDADKYFFESDYILKNYYVAMKNTGGSNTQ
ncbi:MAG TPA: M1 family peptidase, partial [Chitinophagaceae bacterium]|nr:M1 family peptidase [Chitinophagaceae bacterium]